MSDLDDYREWQQISSNVRQCVNRLEVCGICDRTAECVLVVEVLEIAGAYGNPKWACAGCLKENNLLVVDREQK